jgi:hypothetical protein
MPGGNISILGSFNTSAYGVTPYGDPQGNTITSASSVYEGQPVTVSVNPAAGYELVPGTLRYNDGTDHPIDETTRAFTMPGRDVSLGGNFQVIQYGITGYSSPGYPGQGGQISPSVLEAPVGATITVTVSPVAG